MQAQAGQKWQIAQAQKSWCRHGRVAWAEMAGERRKK